MDAADHSAAAPARRDIVETNLDRIRSYYAVFETYAPLWSSLTPDASEKVRKGNFARLFDAARVKVRSWEATHRSVGR